MAEEAHTRLVNRINEDSDAVDDSKRLPASASLSYQPRSVARLTSRRSRGVDALVAAGLATGNTPGKPPMPRDDPSSASDVRSG